MFIINKKLPLGGIHEDLPAHMFPAILQPNALIAKRLPEKGIKFSSKTRKGRLCRFGEGPI
jgi:hypothetical protein